uniref:Hypothetical secreted protein n=1 Tax=Simulium nigrimanum TaxID=683695 RepID=D1FQ42_SIMNI
MSSLLVVLTTVVLAIPASSQSCQSLEVGCCVTIATDNYPGAIRVVYDKASDHWAYMDTKRQSNKSDQWKVKARKGAIFQFESVAFPGRCFCERTHIGTNYGSSCGCRDQEPVQLWELEGVNKGDRVMFKRPKYEYYLYPCSDGSCVKVHWKRYEWILQSC